MKNNFTLTLRENLKDDWHRILALSISLLILFIIIDIWLFISIKKTEAPPVQEEILANRFDLNKLRSTLLYYEGKQSEFDRARVGGKVDVADPSI